ncbi:hypothetical protein CYLTODRAFT_445244 [Cylindrobasidium torrendii FP15055 ss-10]|uniref:Uncharacterized protein n=1 Tax=Cylindrobasidium torrendii FP15055 ss-10 TaxID=1314674 RepID=A0A0D7B527_9AGAR|nr:hypothetical protein CYLTODRAFT_445244 [Cylindrobasidium torrendii FP15055 ss-10]
MPVLYRSEDVSFSDGFYEPATIKALRKGAGRAILECFGGLTRDEFEPFRETAYNQLKVQPSVAECWDLFVAFVPSEDTVAAIHKAFKANGKCRLSERTPFTQIPLPALTTYTLIISPKASQDVFTRHPVTGVVRRHHHPYTDLPKFTLSAHPCIMAEAGRRTLAWRLSPPILTKYFLYTTVRCFCHKLPFWTKPPKTLCVPSPHASSTHFTSDSATRKRKQDVCGDARNSPRPRKMARRQCQGAHSPSSCGSSSGSGASGSTSASHLSVSSDASAAPSSTIVCSLPPTDTKATSTTGKRKRDDCPEGLSSTPTPSPKAARRDSGSGRADVIQ